MPGQPVPAQPVPAQPTPAQPEAPADHAPPPAVPPGGSGGATSLVALAMPLLQLMARLNNTAVQPDQATLRERAEMQIQAFAAQAAAAPVPREQISRAHYALCVSLDDIVLNTPWGSHGAWAQRPLATALYPAVREDRFFALLQQVEEKAESFLPVLALMHTCLSLGYLGPCRQRPDGAAEAERLRAQAAVIIARHSKPVPAELAPQTRGVDAPFVPQRRGVPVWVAGSLGLAALGLLFLFLTYRVSDHSDALFAQMLAAPPSHMPQVTPGEEIPPPPPPPPPDAAPATAQDRLRERLQTEIAAGRVTVAGTATTPVIRIPDHFLFAPNSAALLPEAASLLAQIAAALQPETGHTDVIAYTDNQPVHTVQFPSSFQLCAARAKAVRAAIAPQAAETGAEGRASANPLASNATAGGREQNRRIEIVLATAGGS